MELFQQHMLHLQAHERFHIMPREMSEQMIDEIVTGYKKSAQI